MPEFIVLDIEESDGTDEFYPSNTTKPTNPTRDWEYYRPIVADELKDRLWRTKAATVLAEKFGGANAKGKNYILKSLPANYALFEHVKGHKVVFLWTLVITC